MESKCPLNDPCFDWKKNIFFGDPKLFSPTWGLLSYAMLRTPNGGHSSLPFVRVSTHDPFAPWSINSVSRPEKLVWKFPKPPGKYPKSQRFPGWWSPLNPSGPPQPPVPRFHICDATQSWGNSAYFSQVVKGEAFKFPNIREDIVCFQQKCLKVASHTQHIVHKVINVNMDDF